MQYRTVPYGTEPYRTVPSMVGTVQYRTVPYGTVHLHVIYNFFFVLYSLRIKNGHLGVHYRINRTILHRTVQTVPEIPQ
jgi:hypothetical protein